MGSLMAIENVINSIGLGDLLKKKIELSKSYISKWILQVLLLSIDLEKVFNYEQCIGKEVTISEFKQLLQSHIQRFRRSKKITEDIELLHDIIDMLLNKDIDSRQSFRIGIDEFYLLWQNAQNEKYFVQI